MKMEYKVILAGLVFFTPGVFAAETGLEARVNREVDGKTVSPELVYHEVLEAVRDLGDASYERRVAARRYIIETLRSASGKDALDTLKEQCENERVGLASATNYTVRSFAVALIVRKVVKKDFLCSDNKASEYFGEADSSRGLLKILRAATNADDPFAKALLCEAYLAIKYFGLRLQERGEELRREVVDREPWVAGISPAPPVKKSITTLNPDGTITIDGKTYSLR